MFSLNRCLVLISSTIIAFVPLFFIVIVATSLQFANPPPGPSLGCLHSSSKCVVAEYSQSVTLVGIVIVIDSLVIDASGSHVVVVAVGVGDGVGGVGSGDGVGGVGSGDGVGGGVGSSLVSES